MNKLLAIFCLCVSFVTNGQVLNAISAYKKGDLLTARSVIDSLSSLLENVNNAEIWYNKGLIYESIYTSKDTVLKKSLEEHPLKETYVAFQKVKALTVNKKYAEAAKKRIDSSIVPKLLAESRQLINSKKIEPAVDLLKFYSQNKPNDTIALHLLASSSEKALNYILAKETYNKLLELNAKSISIYKSLFLIQKEEDSNFDEAAKILAIGKKKYPLDNDFPKMEVSLLLATAKHDIAIKKLDSLSNVDPKNKDNYLFNIGAAYEMIDSVKFAVQFYKKALAVNPDHYEANYNLGGIYYSKAGKLYAKINALEYGEYLKTGKILKEEGHVFAKESLPYFEKCYQMKKDPLIKSLLIDIYKNLEWRDKVRQIEKQK